MTFPSARPVFPLRADRDSPSRRVDVVVRALERLFAAGDRDDAPRDATRAGRVGRRPSETEAAACPDSGVGNEGRREAVPAGTGTSVATEVVASRAHDPSGENRRALPRHAGGGAVLVQHLGGERGHDPLRQEWEWHGASARGELVDVSLAGIACLMRQPLERGRRIDVRLWNPRRDVRLERAATVLRCTPAEPGRWKVVCRFAKPLGVDDLQWIAQHVLPHPLV